MLLDAFWDRKKGKSIFAKGRGTDAFLPAPCASAPIRLFRGVYALSASNFRSTAPPNTVHAREDIGAIINAAGSEEQYEVGPVYRVVSGERHRCRALQKHQHFGAMSREVVGKMLRKHRATKERKDEEGGDGQIGRS